jgi:hypothetical protein
MKIRAVIDGKSLGHVQTGILVGMPKCGFVGYHNGREAYVGANAYRSDHEKRTKLISMLMGIDATKE